MNEAKGNGRGHWKDMRSEAELSGGEWKVGINEDSKETRRQGEERVMGRVMKRCMYDEEK